jgi:uncharacterized protein YndB with AHSA1/START domain
MSRNSILIRASPEQVFDVLDDAYAYPSWVLGTRRIRSVDQEWPAVGSMFHHAIGTPVAELHDSSKVVVRQPPEHLELEVRFRPTGVATVCVDIARDHSGSLVTMEETPKRGFFASLPRVVTEPLLAVRNEVSLRRLRHLAEARSDRAAVVGTPTVSEVPCARGRP